MNDFINFFDKIFGFIINIWDSFYQSVIYDDRYKFILEGLLNTIIIAFFAVIIGIVIGIIVSLIRNNYEMNGKMKVGNSIAKCYVNVIRGTPVILQLMIIYYVIFKSVDINIIIVGILTITDNRKKGKCIGCSASCKNCEKLKGNAAESEKEKELIGKPLFQIDRSALLCDIYEKKEALDNFNKEVEINGKFFNLIFSKITNKEKIIGYVLLFIDITKDKQLQKQRQEFASNVSHELKTPLQSIIGRAELIENGIVRPDDLKNFGLKIRTEGQALLNMINDIMFLSKVESGVKAQKEQINIKTLVDSVADSLKDKAQKKQVSIQVNCKEASFLFVRRYMSEILYNLIDNGIKYNKEGGKVECNISTNNQNLYISIKDNGIGIPSEDLGRIFERFFCVDRSHSNKDSTGLGLTIVKHIIEECNGHINVDSKLNVGTTFSITLPIEQ